LSRYAPEFVFEDGDLDKGKLIARFSKDGYPAPIFKPKKDTLNRKTGLIVPGYTPLQAADLWAYELFQADKRAKRGVPFEDFRWAFKELDKMPGEPGVYLQKDMRRLDNMLAQKRSGSRLIQDPASGAILLPKLTPR